MDVFPRPLTPALSPKKGRGRASVAHCTGPVARLVGRRHRSPHKPCAAKPAVNTAPPLPSGRGAEAKPTHTRLRAKGWGEGQGRAAILHDREFHPDGLVPSHNDLCAGTATKRQAHLPSHSHEDMLIWYLSGPRPLRRGRGPFAFAQGDKAWLVGSSAPVAAATMEVTMTPLS
jgi:hypothetical protein